MAHVLASSTVPTMAHALAWMRSLSWDRTQNDVPDADPAMDPAVVAWLANHGNHAGTQATIALATLPPPPPPPHPSPSPPPLPLPPPPPPPLPTVPTAADGVTQLMSISLPPPTLGAGESIWMLSPSPSPPPPPFPPRVPPPPVGPDRITRARQHVIVVAHEAAYRVKEQGGLFAASAVRLMASYATTHPHQTIAIALTTVIVLPIVLFFSCHCFCRVDRRRSTRTQAEVKGSRLPRLKLDRRHKAKRVPRTDIETDDDIL